MKELIPIEVIGDRFPKGEDESLRSQIVALKKRRNAIRQLMTPPETKKKGTIGFKGGKDA